MSLPNLLAGIEVHNFRTLRHDTPDLDIPLSQDNAIFTEHFEPSEQGAFTSIVETFRSAVLITATWKTPSCGVITAELSFQKRFSIEDG